MSDLVQRRLWVKGRARPSEEGGLEELVEFFFRPASCRSRSAICFSASAICFSASAICFSASAICFSASAICFSASAICFSRSAICLFRFGYFTAEILKLSQQPLILPMQLFTAGLVGAPMAIRRCPRLPCAARGGHVGEGAEPHVTVRAMILSLVRFGFAPAEPVKTLEKGWAAYRKQKGLDLCGKTLDPAPTSTRPCAHPDFR